MGSEWERVELRELVEISTEKIAASGIPKGSYVSTDNMAPDFGGVTFNTSTPSVSKTSRFLKDDVLFSNIRTYFRKLWIADRDGGCSNDVIVFRAKKEIHPRFLFYSLMNERFIEYTVQTSKGTKMPRGDKSAIVQYNTALPPLPEQKAIAHILGSLDEKIELNRRMNATLEGMAQALFKSWFVDFDPVIDNALAAGNPIPDELAPRAEVRRKILGERSSSCVTSSMDGAGAPSLPDTTQQGPPDHPTLPDPKSLFPAAFQFSEELGWIPEGWDISTIGSKLETVLGGTPVRKNANFWQNGTVGWINSGKVNEFRITEPSELITEEALAKSATKLLPKRTTVLAITGATLGQVSLTEIICCANQSVVGILGNERVPNEYVYCWLNQIIPKLVASQTGGAQQHINKGNVQEAPILLPSVKVLEAFISQASPAFDQIALGCFESQTLTKLRDTVLPKLIPGGIKIPMPLRATRQQQDAD